VYTTTIRGTRLTAAPARTDQTSLSEISSCVCKKRIFDILISSNLFGSIYVCIYIIYIYLTESDGKTFPQDNNTINSCFAKFSCAPLSSSRSGPEDTKTVDEAYIMKKTEEKKRSENWISTVAACSFHTR